MKINHNTFAQIKQPDSSQSISQHSLSQQPLPRKPLVRRNTNALVKWSAILLSMTSQFTRVGGEHYLRASTGQRDVLENLKPEAQGVIKERFLQFSASGVDVSSPPHVPTELIGQPTAIPSSTPSLMPSMIPSPYPSEVPTTDWGQGPSEFLTPTSIQTSSPTLTESISSTTSTAILRPEGLEQITTYLNSELWAPPELLGMARSYLAVNLLPTSAEQMTQFAAELFAFMKNEFVKQTTVIEDHVAWHREHGSGGTRGPGSGVIFLDLHKGMMNDVKRYMGGLNQILPMWTNFHTNILALIPQPLGVTRKPLQNPPNFEKPFFLTLEGDGEQTLTFEGMSIASLNDIPTIDLLGRIIGEEFHGVGHVYVGGTMTGYESPRDPMFDLWHNAIEGIVEDWLTTSAGQAFIQTPEGAAWYEARDQLTALRVPSEPSSVPSLSPSQFLSQSPSQVPSSVAQEVPTHPPMVSPVSLQPTPVSSLAPSNHPEAVSSRSPSISPSMHIDFTEDTLENREALMESFEQKGLLQSLDNDQKQRLAEIIENDDLEALVIFLYENTQFNEEPSVADTMEAIFSDQVITLEEVAQLGKAMQASLETRQELILQFEDFALLEALNVQQKESLQEILEVGTLNDLAQFIFENTQFTQEPSVIAVMREIFSDDLITFAELEQLGQAMLASLQARLSIIEQLDQDGLLNNFDRQQRAELDEILKLGTLRELAIFVFENSIFVDTPSVEAAMRDIFSGDELGIDQIEQLAQAMSEASDQRQALIQSLRSERIFDHLNQNQVAALEAIVDSGDLRALAFFIFEETGFRNNAVVEAQMVTIFADNRITTDEVLALVEAIRSQREG